MSRKHTSLCFLLFGAFGPLAFICNVDAYFLHPYNLKGRQGEGYYVEAEIGSPPQNLNISIDTGSSNLAVAGTAHPLVDTYFKSERSQTYVYRDEDVGVPYAQGCWDGKLGSDMISIPSLHNLVSVRCDIASILSSTNFYINGSHWQGILGLAYPSMSRPTSHVLSWLEAVSYVSGHNVSQYHFRTIPLPFTLELCGPYNEDLDHNGHFVVGDFLSVPSPGIPQWFLSPVMKEDFYELLLTGIELGGHPVNLPCQEFNYEKAIMDSGTTELMLPEKVFQAVVDLIENHLYQNGISEPSEFWEQKSSVCWTKDSAWKGKKWLDSFPNITLSLAHTPYFSSGYNPSTNQFVRKEMQYPYPIKSYFKLELPAKSYVRRVKRNEFDTSASQPNENCYHFGIESSEAGAILGVVVMEGLNIMFNQSGRVVGFAESDCGPEVHISGPFPLPFDGAQCAHHVKSDPVGAIALSVYIIGAFLVTLIAIFGAKLLFLVCLRIWASCRVHYLYLLLPSRKRNSSVVSLVAPEI